jgi:hypothetical protein
LLGLSYSLSPLVTLCVPALAGIAWWAGRRCPPRERRWFLAIVGVAVIVRLAVIAGLFLSADDTVPYTTFFGDEQFFKNRSLWVRNLGMGVSISPADLIYAFEAVGESSYLYFLALLQSLVGAAPYGLHVLNASLYLVAAIVLYRLVRPAYGAVASLAGLGLLLFLPSLFVWSVSALKEPAYTFLAAGELFLAVQVVRQRHWLPRLIAAVALVGSAIALESVRRGGFSVAAIGVVAGLSFWLIVSRPRLALASLVIVPVAAALVLALPPVNQRLLELARRSAMYHAGHVISSGVSYRLIEPRYYLDRRLIPSMPPREAAVYVARSVAHYLAEPLPWRRDSTAIRAYVPEQVVWYALVLLVPIGLGAGLHRDPLLTSLLAAHAGAVIMMVAMTSGNIGTLIRHRGLVLPYLAWLAGLGAVGLIRVAVQRSPHADG